MQAEIAALRFGLGAKPGELGVRNENGPDVAVLEASGWDTHANQGAAKGPLANRLQGLDQAIKAFADEMPDVWPRTAVLIVTEFGRTAAINGTRGTRPRNRHLLFSGGRCSCRWPGSSGLARPRAIAIARAPRPKTDARFAPRGLFKS